MPVGPATEISAPGQEVFYLYGHGVPAPPAGMVYRVWLVAGTTPTYVGEFVPDDGFVNVELHFDPNSYDALWVTEALAGSEHAAPSADEALWQAAG